MGGAHACFCPAALPPPPWGEAMLMGARPPAQGAIEAWGVPGRLPRPGSVSGTVSSARAEPTAALQGLTLLGGQDGQASDPAPGTGFSAQWVPSRPSSRVRSQTAPRPRAATEPSLPVGPADAGPG